MKHTITKSTKTEKPVAAKKAPAKKVTAKQMEEAFGKEFMESKDKGAKKQYPELPEETKKVEVRTFEGELSDLPKMLDSFKMPLRGFFILIGTKGSYPVIASKSWIITKKMMAAMEQLKSKGVIVAVVGSDKMENGYYLYPEAKVSEVLGNYMASNTYKTRGNYSQSRHIASHGEFFKPTK